MKSMFCRNRCRKEVVVLPKSMFKSGYRIYSLTELVLAELGSFVVQRFGAVVLRFGALVLWSHCAQVLKSPVSLSSSLSNEAQRKGAKEIHKYFMAKKSLNESRKSTIHKVVALTAHSNSSEHSSSSSKHKKSNGSTRS
ncbi:hypothetical protein Taro_046883, partial [Colocasia esculenta]|nr:hypothetical protein [Colocasia esculenta]